jgi:hypothetical protein
MREVDMGTDRGLFSEGDEGLPVFEGRMIEPYDYRAKGYVSGRGAVGSLGGSVGGLETFAAAGPFTILLNERPLEVIDAFLEGHPDPNRKADH